MAGIENLKEIIALGGDVTFGFARSLEDGKLSFQDLPNFLPAARTLLPAIKDIDQVDDEFADLDDSERAELIAYFADRFDLPSDEVERVIEKLFRVGLDLADVIGDVAGLLKKE